MSDGSDTNKQGPFELLSDDIPCYAPSRSQPSSASAPAPVVSNEEDEPATGSMEPPVRKYGCRNYDTCLDLAAALNWASFTCGACSGTINEQLLWRARHVTRRDSVAKALCELPPVASFEQEGCAAKKKQQ